MEALEKIGNRDYARALETPLRNPELIMTISNWVRDHHLTKMKPVFENLMENPPEKGGGGPYWSVIEALGKIGDEQSGARLAARLKVLTSRQIPELWDDGVTGAIIGALADLRYTAARADVE